MVPAPARRARLALLAIATAVGGCSSWDVKGPTLPTTPEVKVTLLTGSPYDGHGIALDWTPPVVERTRSTLGGVVLFAEIWTDAGALVQAWGSDARSGHTEANLGGVPDGTRVWVRACLAANGTFSTFGTPVSATMTVRAPSSVSAYPYVPAVGPTSLLVTWIRNSPNAEAVRLERQFRPVAAAPGPWETLPVTDPGVTRYEDHDIGAWRDGNQFAYRVTHLVGSVESAPAEGATGGGRPLEPVSVLATATATGVHVSWVYPGLESVEVRVRRVADGYALEQTVGVASPGATALDDVAPPPGLWRYTVQAHPAGQASWGAESLSDPVELPVLVPFPEWSGKLTGTALAMPPASEAVRDSAGRFALAWAGTGNPLTLSLPEGGARVTWSAPAGAYPAHPAIAFDPADRLHFFYGTSTGAVMHGWREAGAWAEESAGTVAGYQPLLEPFVDGVGDLHLLWERWTGSPAAPQVTWAVRRAGAWSSEDLPGALAAYPRVGRALADAAGWPGFSATDGTTVYLVRRGATGWTAEATPATPGMLGWPTGSLPAADRAIQFGSANAPPAFGCDIWIRERTPAGWLAPEKASSASCSGSIVNVASPDGARVAVVSTAPAQVAIRTGGVWTTLPLSPTFRGVAAGFTPAGKLWILSGLRTSLDLPPTPLPDVTYALYEEP